MTAIEICAIACAHISPPYNPPAHWCALVRPRCVIALHSLKHAHWCALVRNGAPSQSEPRPMNEQPGHTAAGGT